MFPVSEVTFHDPEVGLYMYYTVPVVTVYLEVHNRQYSVSVDEVEVVRRFLFESELPDGVLTGCWSELRGLFRVHLSYGIFLNTGFLLYVSFFRSRRHLK